MDIKFYHWSTKGHSIQVNRITQTAMRINQYVTCYDMLLSDDVDKRGVKEYQLRFFVNEQAINHRTQNRPRRSQPLMKVLLVDPTASEDPYKARKIAGFTAHFFHKTMSLANNTKLECVTYEILLPLLAHIAESTTPNLTVEDVTAFLSRETTWNNSIFKTINVYMSPNDLCAPNPRLELRFGYKRSPNSQPFYISNNVAETKEYIEHLIGVWYNRQTHKDTQEVPVGPLAQCLAYLDTRAIDGRALYAMRNDIALLRGLFLTSFFLDGDEHGIAITFAITLNAQNALEIWDDNNRTLRLLYKTAVLSSIHSYRDAAEYADALAVADAADVEARATAAVLVQRWMS